MGGKSRPALALNRPLTRSAGRQNIERYRRFLQQKPGYAPRKNFVHRPVSVRAQHDEADLEFFDFLQDRLSGVALHEKGGAGYALFRHLPLKFCQAPVLGA